MSDLSFTSSSEPSLALAPAGGIEALAAGCRRLPLGFLSAAVLVTTLHLTAVTLCPEPLANDFARRLAWTGTRTCAPAIILGGDSRVQLGLDPAHLNHRLALPEGQVLSLAMPCGDSTVFTAAYRKFAPHFAPRPVVLFGVSMFSVNDGAIGMISDEFLQTVSVRDRLQLVRPAEAIADIFLREKTLWGLSTAPLRDLFPSRKALFVPPIPASWNVSTWTPKLKTTRLHGVTDFWYNRPNLDGLRWRKFAQDIVNLQAAGAQLIIADLPYHPIVTGAIAEPPLSEAHRRFQAKVDELCRRLGIPVLRYDVADLGSADIDAVFLDLTHLNEAGAALLTDRVAEDVARLIAAGRLRLPDSLMPATRRHDAYAAGPGLPPT